MSQTSDQNDTFQISLRKIVDNTASITGAGGGGAINSVNGKTGVVVLNAADVGATTSGGGFSWADLFSKYSFLVPIRNFNAAFQDYGSGQPPTAAWMNQLTIGYQGFIKLVAGSTVNYDDVLYYLPNCYEPVIGTGNFGPSALFRSIDFHTYNAFCNSGGATAGPGGTPPNCLLKFPGATPITDFVFFINTIVFRNPGYMAGGLYKSFTGPTDEACVLVPGVLPNNSAGVKVCMYFHGSGGDDYLSLVSSVSATQKSGRDTLLGLLADGWTIISSSGGPNITHWGNPESWLATQAALTWLKSIVNVSTLVVIGQSMGGLSSLRAAAYYPGVSKWYGIAPCTNLDWLYQNQPIFLSTMNTAYGSSDYATFVTASAGCDPQQFPVTQFNGLKMRSAASYGDTTVDRVNNTDALVTRLGAHPASFTVLTSTGTHADTSNFNSSDILPFINS